MAEDINKAKEETDKSPKEFNAMNTPIGNMPECVSNMTDTETKQGVFNGSIPYVVYNLGTTSSCGQKDDPFITVGERAHKTFHIPTGEVAEATEKMLIYHKVQEPASMIDTVPKIVEDSLLLTGKFSDTEYVSIFNKDEVDIYVRNDTLITVTNKAILKGWRDPASVLCRVPLVPKAKNLNTETVLGSKPPTEY